MISEQSERPVVIISGASRGLGEATARALFALGANTAINARSAEDLRALAAEIDPGGERVVALAGDVSHADTCRNLVQQTVAHFGRLDAVVNNAAVIRPVAAIADADPAAWETNLIVNVAGPFYLTHFALPYLRQQDGRVANVSSGAAVSAIAGWSAYCAGKAGLNHFTRVLAMEEASITAFSFRPGVVDTEMQATLRAEGAEGMTPEEHARFLRYHEEDELLPPELPGRALAVLALMAPRDWSGEFIQWDEARVQNLVRQHGVWNEGNR